MDDDLTRLWLDWSKAENGADYQWSLFDRYTEEGKDEEYLTGQYLWCLKCDKNADRTLKILCDELTLRGLSLTLETSTTKRK